MWLFITICLNSIFKIMVTDKLGNEIYDRMRKKGNIFFKAIIFILFFLSISIVRAQKADSAYVTAYHKKMWVTGYVSTSTLQLNSDNTAFVPNSPINAGVGLGIRNTMINFLLGHSIIPLKGSDYGKTKSTDLQIHNYGRHYVIDLYYQKYKGFYTEDKKIINLFPDLSVQQIGAEGTYIFNGNKFSAKAAFEQSEKQKASVGSFLLGGGAYWHRVVQILDNEINDRKPFNNLQLGVNGGYAYSWVVDKHWLLTGMATIGANFGNEMTALKDGKIKIYPTALARAASTYHRDDWSLSFSMLINNKVVYPKAGSTFDITALSMQLSYVKQIDGIFKKMK